MTGLQALGPALPGLSAVFGLLIGSFLNVVVHRVPAGQSVVSPPSACPACRHTIRRRDNVPVLSWLVLRGRCRDCSAPISARYPAVELATAVLFGLTAFVVVGRSPAGTAQDTVAQVVILVALLYLMAISVALTLIDIATHTLPNAIVYPSGIVLTVLLVVASAADGDWSALGRAAIGALGSGALYLGLALAVPGGMGLGDVKLAVVLGLVLAYLGWGPLAVGSFAAFLLGGTFAVVLLVVRRAGRRSGIPFGPWMLAGAWLGIAVGAPAWDGYLRLLGLA